MSVSVNNTKNALKCPRCDSERTIWTGYRHNKSQLKRVRRCKNCGKKFTPGNVFPRARYDGAYMIEAAGLFHGGLSLNDVKDHMLQHRNVKVSRTSILKWTRKYEKLVEDFASKLKLVIRGVGHSDDVYIELVGNDVNYWGAKDSKIMFKIESKLSFN